MKDSSKSEQELIEEIAYLKQRIKALEQSQENVIERKQTQEGLLITRLQLSEAMDLAHIVYWESDPVTGAFILNDPFYASCGTTAEKEGGYRMTREEYVKRFVHPDDTALFHRAAEKRIADEKQEFFNELEHRIIRRDGEVRHIVTRIRAIRDAAGSTIKLYGANQDVTERKNMVEALRQSEELYRMITEKIRDVIWIHDTRSDKFVYMSPSAFHLTGYTAQESMELPLEMTFTPASVAIINEDMRRSFESISSGQLIENHRLELEIICKNGSTKWVETDIEGIYNTAGDIVAIRGVGRDITERKQAEEERERLILELREVLSQVKTLSGLLPICASCKKIRNDKGHWEQMEVYIRDRSEADFSHGICPECIEKLYPGYNKEIIKE